MVDDAPVLAAAARGATRAARIAVRDMAVRDAICVIIWCVEITNNLLFPMDGRASKMADGRMHCPRNALENG